MSGIVSRAELLRPFADAPCQTPEFHHLSSSTRKCASCGGLERNSSGLDKLYAALRGEHHIHEQLIYAHGRKAGFYCIHCEHYEFEDDNPMPPYCLRSDVGSVLRAAAACGLAVAYMGPVVGGFDGHQVVLQKWHGYFNPTDDKHLGQGDTDEDAFAAAFAAAVQERAS